jgi:hypothetical protein
MVKSKMSVDNISLLQAALEGLEMQKQRLEAQISEVRSLLGQKASVKLKSTPVPAPSPASSRRDLSAAARKRIADAQKKRWAEFRKKKQSAK